MIEFLIIVGLFNLGYQGGKHEAAHPSDPKAQIAAMEKQLASSDGNP
jgi:hypothetical protein